MTDEAKEITAPADLFSKEKDVVAGKTAADYYKEMFTEEAQQPKPDAPTTATIDALQKLSQAKTGDVGTTTTNQGAKP